MKQWLGFVILAIGAANVNCSGGYGGGIETQKGRAGRIQIPVGLSMDLAMAVGTPPQPLRMLFSFEFSEVIIVDSLCGVHRKDCPRYCSDKDFAPIHCSARCQVFTPQSASLLCRGSVDQFRYDGQNSSTSENLKIQWRKRLRGTQKIYGHLWVDDLRFLRNGYGRYDQIFQLVGQTFVSADLFDLRTSRYDTEHGFFGMKPTADSAIRQFFYQHTIFNEIISLGGSPEYTQLLRREHYDDYVMTAGGLDKARCVDWEWFPSGSSDSFVINVNKVEFLGETFRLNGTVMFDFAEFTLSVPSPAWESLKRSGRIEPGTPWAAYSCPLHLYKNPLTFTVGRKRLHFRSQTITLFRSRVGRSTEFRCSSYMSSAPTPKYSWEQWKWSVGVTFLTEHCVAFDYKNMRIAVGRRRFKDQPDHRDEDSGSDSDGSSEDFDDVEVNKQRMGLRRVMPLKRVF